MRSLRSIRTIVTTHSKAWMLEAPWMGARVGMAIRNSSIFCEQLNCEQNQ